MSHRTHIESSVVINSAARVTANCTASVWAEVLVESESELYCWEAFIKLHRKGKRRWTGAGGRLVTPSSVHLTDWWGLDALLS